MSSAWISFVKTGNPNTKGLPEWIPFTSDKQATMIFDNECYIRYNNDDVKELYGLTDIK